MTAFVDLALLLGAMMGGAAFSTLAVCWWWRRRERRRAIEDQVDRILREALVAAVDEADSAR